MYAISCLGSDSWRKMLEAGAWWYRGMRGTTIAIDPISCQWKLGLGSTEKLYKVTWLYKWNWYIQKQNHPELEHSCYLLVFSFLALKYVTSKSFTVQD